MIIFDNGRGQLGPMTDLRASFEVRTGMFTTAGRLAAFRPRTLAGYWAPQRLVGLLRERGNAPVNVLPNEELILCVNGRWALPNAELLPEEGEAIIERASEHVVAALLRRADADYFLGTGELPERVRVREIEQRVLYRYPWDVLALLKDALRHDIGLTRIIRTQAPERIAVVMGEEPIEIDITAKIAPSVTFDASAGPIMIHEHAVIRPGAIICGPCSIGAHAHVLERAIIKANTVIGPRCKVAGEIGATIFQGYSNKAHDGHLGDSWIGKWVNFGAGTTNSNLLNTYGEVTARLEPSGPRHRTGLTFLGTIAGDHAKFAICTRLMTGSVIGTGAMIACTATPPTCVKRFAWLTDEGERSFRLDKFLDVAERVMARRDRTPTEAYKNVVRELHARNDSPRRATERHGEKAKGIEALGHQGSE